jgi:hypothetical protein
VSSTAFKIGVMAFVVQDAAEKMLLISVVFVMVYTMNNIRNSLSGAVSNTLSAPLETK